MGLMLAEPGFHTRCFVEIDEYPRSSLIAAQRAGYFAPAPIWDDLAAFDAKPFAGAFDTLLAGYPCQPFSQAGQRRGANDERHLWPDIARIIGELGHGLEWVFLENVAGHVSLGLETVLRDLWRLGFTPAAGLFTAAETGAAHERQRVFIVAYREGPDRRREQSEGSARGGRTRSSGGGAELADAARSDRRVHAGQRPEGGGATDAGRSGGPLGNAQILGRGEGRAEPALRGWGDAPPGSGGAMANAGAPGFQGREQSRSLDQWHRTPAHGSTSELRRPLLHAPGPAEMDLWRFALDLAPDLAPATSLGDIASIANIAAQMVAAGRMEEASAESLVRRMVDGMAARPRALRLLGNGVHPLAAAYAWRTLSPAFGLRPVDFRRAG